MEQVLHDAFYSSKAPADQPQGNCEQRTCIGVHPPSWSPARRGCAHHSTAGVNHRNCLPNRIGGGRALPCLPFLSLQVGTASFLWHRHSCVFTTTTFWKLLSMYVLWQRPREPVLTATWVRCCSQYHLPAKHRSQRSGSADLF